MTTGPLYQVRNIARLTSLGQCCAAPYWIMQCSSEDTSYLVTDLVGGHSASRRWN